MALCGDDHKKVLDRINRIEGQVRGLKKMVEDDRDCLDVLKQIAAAAGALRSLGAVILEDHLKGCVTRAVTNQDHVEETLREVVDIFNKFSK
ncbi:MAG: metal-sensitive transcriptional regulator [Pseudomonadota bacterium]